MSDYRPPLDPEVEALERRLDALFSAHPRPGFEGELWSRLERSRGRPAGLRAALAAFMASLTPGRVAPALAAVAVAVGIGVLAAHGGLGYRGGGSPSSSQYSGRASKGAATAPAPGTEAFGKLPAPAPPVGPAGGASFRSSQRDAFRVPASPPGLPTTAPVYRYPQPGSAEADSFAAGLGASPSGMPPPGALGVYAGPGFTLTVEGADAALGRPPTYRLQGTPPPGRLPGPPNLAAGPLVDWTGSPVPDLLPLGLAVSIYPLRSVAAALPAATSAPSGTRFTQVRLAYLAVGSGPAGYLEPVYLFSDAGGGRHAIATALAAAALMPGPG